MCACNDHYHFLTPNGTLYDTFGFLYGLWIDIPCLGVCEIILSDTGLKKKQLTYVTKCKYD